MSTPEDLPNPEGPPKKKASGLGPVLLTVLLDLVGFGIVIPLISFYGEAYDATEREALLLLGMYSVAQFLFAPMWGWLSDRYGRRPIMLMSIAATSIALAGFATAPNLLMLFVWRFAHGAFAANISTAQAYVADVTKPEDRARGMGLIGAAFGFGFTLGPFLGGELSVYGLVVPIWFAAGLSAINFLWAFFGLPESRVLGEKGRGRRAGPAMVVHALSHPVIGLAIGLTFAATLAFAMMEYTFPLVAEHKWQLDERSVGRFFGLIGIIGIVIQGGMIRPLVKRFGEGKLIVAGYLLNVAGLGALAVVMPGVGLPTACALLATGSSIANPSLQSMISRGAGEDEQGAILGVNQSLSALARAIAPWGALALYTQTHRVGPFLGAGAVMLVALFLAIPATQRARRARVADEAA